MPPKKLRPGVPYLRSSLKFNWASTDEMDGREITEILESIGSELVERGLAERAEDRGEASAASTSQSATLAKNEGSVESAGKKQKRQRPRLSFTDRETPDACVGLNAVFRAMSEGRADVAVFDSSILKASAVAAAIGMYAHSCSRTTSSFSVPGLDAALSARLGRRGTEAVAFTSDGASSALCTLLRNTLRRVTIDNPNANPSTPSLPAASSVYSVGKDPAVQEKKKRKKKKALTTS